MRFFQLMMIATLLAAAPFVDSIDRSIELLSGLKHEASLQTQIEQRTPQYVQDYGSDAPQISMNN